MWEALRYHRAVVLASVPRNASLNPHNIWWLPSRCPGVLKSYGQSFPELERLNSLAGLTETCFCVPTGGALFASERPQLPHLPVPL